MTQTAIRAENRIAVGLGDMSVVTDSETTLACLGLGSCVGIAASDQQASVYGMAHIVLPNSGGRSTESKAKYADTGVPRLIEEMVANGAIKSRIRFKIAGGAQMALSNATNPVFKIGERNIEAVTEAAKAAGIRIVSKELGGSRGRTLRLETGSGRVFVSEAGATPEEL
ncbi:MAG: chemotaxis protein CheD [Chloroflexi bacterium]|nr:chemotaxis protein CheD [Chloroflexota bacterium]